MNATFEKFGWPGTKIVELAHWGIMLRPEQPTLGSLVLACKQPVTAFSEVDAAGFAELQTAIAGIERMLSATVDYEKINYLMLMMVDPDVHFHVIPRYDGARTYQGIEVADAGWPGPPALGTVIRPDPAQQAQLVDHLRDHWPVAG